MQRTAFSMLRITVSALTIIAVLALLLHLSHRKPPETPKDDSAVAAIASTTPGPLPVEARSPGSEGEILANCHPHLGPNPGSVPNIDVSEKPNPAAARLKVRLWVNGDGFVTQAFLAGANAYTAEEQEDALHYTKGLTFSVPNTAECVALKTIQNTCRQEQNGHQCARRNPWT
jgi:hypothetical protein